MKMLSCLLYSALGRSYNQQQKQEQSGPATEPNSPAAARARPSDCSKPSSRTRAQSLPQNCISQHRVLTNSANATASGSSNDSHCPALAKSCTPNGSPSASPPSPKSAAPRWPPVGLAIQQETTDCGRVHSACRPAASGGGISPDSVASSEWTAARLTRSSSTFAGLFVGVGGRQCAAAVAALAADYAAAELASNSPIEARDARRSLLRQFDWSDNEDCCSNSHSPGEDAAAVDGNADVPAVSLRRPGSGQFVPEDLVSMAKADWLTERLLRAANSQPDADCTTADRLCQAMIRLDADLCGAAGQSAWTLRAATTGAVGSACLISGDGSRCCLMQIGNSAAVIGSRSAPIAAASDAEDGTDSVNNVQTAWRWRQPLAQQTIENGREVRRVLAEHPASERGSVFAGNRLLGRMEALRAFGLVQLKWPKERLNSWTSWPAGQSPPSCETPPYLTARPEVIEVGIDPAADRFIILGSPGLWDRLSPQQAVACVGGQLLAAQSQGSNPSGENLAATLVQLAESCGHRDSAAGFNEADWENEEVSACIVLLH
ncbi:hypothetical protein BOX15_Mlig012261g1 [Macrostomum lignano]|uniref:PPM-type phosphatase domain-containing protein n=1 Tax=Macrostomum lignano TaxID=282301 RepID=A0A267FS21_9PLAT|nr:hypothetical protein BOX15_Mlig012261g1 [Macrostomum lignano]